MHWMIRSPAWRALTPAARALYVELAQRYNSINNGEIAMPFARLRACSRVAKDTASKTFHELEEKGVIKRNVCGSFNWKLKYATTWILTEFPLGENPPTKEFARWQLTNPETQSQIGDEVSQSGDGRREILVMGVLNVPSLGPWVPFRHPHGPKWRHAYSLPCHAQHLTPRRRRNDPLAPLRSLASLKDLRRSRRRTIL